jgi:hypothetical protein
MASVLQKIRVEVSPIMGATLDAAWTASKAGAISFAVVFTIANLAFGLSAFAAGHMKMLDLLGVVAGGIFILLLSLLFSLVITVPVSAIVATCAYPFLRNLRVPDRRVFGAVGFVVGALVWLCAWWNGPPGNLYFGSWFSIFAIGGLAGGVGGLTFARHFPMQRQAQPAGAD